MCSHQGLPLLHNIPVTVEMMTKSAGHTQQQYNPKYAKSCSVFFKESQSMQSFCHGSPPKNCSTSGCMSIDLLYGNNLGEN